MPSLASISVAVTTYNRLDLTISAALPFLLDDRVSEIVIVDDCSTDGSYEKLVSFFAESKKTFIYRNDENIGMSKNKKKAVFLCQNPWVLLIDSDNSFDKSYLDAFFKEVQIALPNVIYAPSAAKPHFIYRQYQNMIFSAANARNFIGQREFDCAINTCNYIVNRKFYLDAYVYDPEVKESDTVWHLYNHLKAGGKMKIVEGMEYDHLVHDGSGWRSHADENMAKANEIKELIRNL